jgi:hypothetical protein
MNPTDILKYGHSFVTRTIEGLPFSNWETAGVCGVWSVKDIIGHLAAYELLLTEVLAPFTDLSIESKIMPQIGQIGIAAFNDAQAALRQNLTPQQALAEYTNNFTYNQEKVVPKVAAAKWSQIGTLPWYGAEYSLDDYIVYSFYGHKREHSAEINVFKDRLKSG